MENIEIIDVKKVLFAMLYNYYLAARSLLADAELPGVHLLGQGVRLPPAVLLAGVLAPVHLHLALLPAALLALGHSMVLTPTTSAHQQARNRSNINQSEIKDDENLK